MGTYIKDPDSKLDYGFDWSEWLGADTISSSSWVIASGLTKVSDSASTTVTAVTISGGIIGQQYVITNRIITAAGRQDDRSHLIAIREPESIDSEPVSLAEAKRHLQFDPDTAHADDSLIEALIMTARLECEAYQGRSYLTQTRTMILDKFPKAREIEIPYPPLQSITSLVYKDSSRVTQTVSYADDESPSTPIFEDDTYLIDIDSQPGRLILKTDQSWPSTANEAAAIKITYVAGYGDTIADVPRNIRQAILMRVADLYENRGETDDNPQLSKAFEALLWAQKVYPL
jgi:uncharacterized phiE125 gp8 family phage protein